MTRSLALAVILSLAACASESEPISSTDEALATETTADTSVVLADVAAPTLADAADAITRAFGCATIVRQGGALDVSFDCAGPLVLVGTVHVDLSLERMPAVAVLQVSSEGLSIRDSFISGAWELRRPLDLRQPATYTGHHEVTGPNGRTLSLSSDVTWTRTSADCISWSGHIDVTGPNGESGSIDVTDREHCRR